MLMWLLLLFCKYQFSPFHISVDSNVAIFRCVGMGEVLQTAWGLVAHWRRTPSHRATSGNISRYWSQPSHIIWLPIIISQDIQANHVTSSDSQLLCQPLPEPQNGAPIDELEDQPGIFERKDLLTKVEYFWRNGHKDILHRLYYVLDFYKL